MSLPASCRDCWHSTNSAKLHDDPFTSTPHPINWYCGHAPELRRVENEYVRDDKCPLETKEQA